MKTEDKLRDSGNARKTTSSYSFRLRQLRQGLHAADRSKLIMNTTTMNKHDDYEKKMMKQCGSRNSVSNPRQGDNSHFVRASGGVMSVAFSSASKNCLHCKHLLDSDVLPLFNLVEVAGLSGNVFVAGKRRHRSTARTLICPSSN